MLPSSLLVPFSSQEPSWLSVQALLSVQEEQVLQQLALEQVALEELAHPSLVGRGLLLLRH
jgi:hypothetical protein